MYLFAIYIGYIIKRKAKSKVILTCLGFTDILFLKSVDM